MFSSKDLFWTSCKRAEKNIERLLESQKEKGEEGEMMKSNGEQLHKSKSAESLSEEPISQVKASKKKKNQNRQIFATLPKNLEKSTSIYFIDFINFFGQKKGFDKIVELVSSSFESSHENSDQKKDKPKQLSLEIAYNLIKLFDYISKYLSTDFLKEYVPKLHGAVFEYLLNQKVFFNSKNNLDDKKKLEIIQTIVQDLLKPIYSENKLEEIREGFNLDISWKLFNSPNLEKSLRGIKYIKKLALDKIEEKDKSFLSDINLFKKRDDSEKKKTSQVDPQFLIEWIKQKVTCSPLIPSPFCF